MFNFLRKQKCTPLVIKGDINNECELICEKIIAHGDRIISCTRKDREALIVYRSVCNKIIEEDHTVFLKLKIVTYKGIKEEIPRLNAVYHIDENRIHIGDIDVHGDNINKGYGTLLMKALFSIAYGQKIKKITGDICEVDWDHVERLKYFYSKNGFKVKLNCQNKQGEILWINKDI